MLNLQNCGTLSCDRPWKRNLRLHTKLRWNRMIPGWVIAVKPFSNGGWPPSWIFEIWHFGHESCVRTSFCFILQNFALIVRWDIAKRRFSIWRPSAILNLKKNGILLSRRPWKQNLHLHTKFRWNRMICGWDIAIKLFSKWRPSAILNFRNSVFWSYGLC